MKKILVVVAVLAITVVSSMAFAASEVNVSGSIDFRQRAFNNLDNNADLADSNRDTQTRVRITFDAKASDAVARVQIQKDWEQWGETTGGFLNTDIAKDNGNFDAIRESWIDFPLFGSWHLKGGHQFLSLGNKWFLRNDRNGDDAWVLYSGMGDLTVALVDAKIVNRTHNNDSDFYAALGVMKLGDMGTVGANLSHIILAKKGVASATHEGNTLQNIGLHADLNLGALKLKGQFDKNMGKDKGDPIAGDPQTKYKDTQLVIEGTIPAGAVTVNALFAQGSGNAVDPVAGGPAAGDFKEFIAVQDIDPHYTFLYEYKVKTAALFDPYGFGAETGKHTSFANTTALGAGADVKVSDAVTVGASAWFLKATKKTNINGATDVAGNLLLDDELGVEIDGRVKWKISENVSWNISLGYFMAGKAYDYPTAVNGANKSADETTGIQGVLGMKF